MSPVSPASPISPVSSTTLSVLHPAGGARLPISQFIRFEGTASGDAITQVQFIADGQIGLGTATVSAGRWTFIRKFSQGGARQITVIGTDDNGAEIAQAEISITLLPSSDFGYTPPEATLPHLGSIASLLEAATKIDKTFAPLDHLDALFRLPSEADGDGGGVLYFESNLDLDTDRARSPGLVYESTHQDQTSLRHADGTSLDSNTIPFFVLPGIHAGGGSSQVTLGGMVFSLGDIAAVLFRDRISFAVFGDFGPRKKIGEGSIALHRALGHETVRPSGRIRDVDIEKGVVTLVFPNSGDGTPQTPQAIAEQGAALFTALGGVLV